MENVYYTLGRWKVKAGREAEFVEAWQEVGKAFFSLPHPPGSGTLLQSMNESNLFYSFGPWDSREDIEAMRANPAAQAALRRLMDLCDEGMPGTYLVAARADR